MLIFVLKAPAKDIVNYDLISSLENVVTQIGHEATVTFNIGAEDGGEFAFKTFVCHGEAPTCLG